MWCEIQCNPYQNHNAVGVFFAKKKKKTKKRKENHVLKFLWSLKKDQIAKKTQKTKKLKTKLVVSEF